MIVALPGPDEDPGFAAFDTPADDAAAAPIEADDGGFAAFEEAPPAPTRIPVEMTTIRRVRRRGSAATRTGMGSPSRPGTVMTAILRSTQELRRSVMDMTMTVTGNLTRDVSVMTTTTRRVTTTMT